MEPTHTHLSPQTKLSGGYTIIKKLGSGGFGITYLAQNNLGKEYVLKEMYLEGKFVRKANGTISLQGFSRENYEKFKERFIREAKTLQRLSGHDHIVNVENYFEENNTVYIVMEYLRGQSLEDMVAQKGRMSESEALGYMKQVAAALSYIHEKKFYHRDVKPANIMVTNGEAKLIDFGISKKVDDEIEVSKHAAFSPSYASIEQQDADSEINAAMDVYSLAATLYYCLMGQKPKKALTRLKRQEKELDLSGISLSASVANALQKGMALYEGNRYTSVEALMKGLRTPIQPSPTPKPNPVKEKEVTELSAQDYLDLANSFYKDEAYEKALSNYRAITPDKPQYEYAQSQIKRCEEALTPPKPKMNVKMVLAGLGLLLVMGNMMLWMMNRGVEKLPKPDPVVQAWQALDRTDTLALADFIANYKNGAEVDSAKVLLNGLQADAKAKKDSIAAAQASKAEQDAIAAAQAKEKEDCEALAKKLSKSGTVRECKNFVRDYDGICKTQAVRNRIADLEKQESKPPPPKRKTLPSGMKMITVNSGSFTMGQNDPNLGCSGCSDDEGPSHTVTLKSFQLSETEVTNAQYAEFLRAKRPSKTEAEKWIEIGSSHCKITSSYGVESGYENHPVVEVSWYGAKAFCEYYGGRLPTEAEWEYAARGGHKKANHSDRWAGTDSESELHKYANYDEGGAKDGYKRTSPVKSCRANEIGTT